jgi:hypothetical protein
VEHTLKLEELIMRKDWKIKLKTVEEILKET